MGNRGLNGDVGVVNHDGKKRNTPESTFLGNRSRAELTSDMKSSHSTTHLLGREPITIKAYTSLAHSAQPFHLSPFSPFSGLQFAVALALLCFRAPGAGDFSQFHL